MSYPTVKKSAVITITDQVGRLKEICEAFAKFKTNLTSIQSRPATGVDHGYDFFIDFEWDQGDASLQTLVKYLEVQGAVRILSQSSRPSSISLTKSAIKTETPWFPRKMSDLDGFAEKTLEMGEDLEADHPGFNDAVYRKRRYDIVQLAKSYRTGQEIARIEYTPVEIETWGSVYKTLKQLYPTHACREHNHILPLLEQNCGYGPDSIPQLEDVSRFLQSCTGWRLRPVMGLLSPRDFLNGLAFRVFHSTQYIRHHSKPLYTPEPDVCHELLGHVPLFADPAFAEFSHEIGLASLGASEEEINKLATVYWFTIEFGVCRQDGKLKAYGAGLLSSFGELEYCVSNTPTFKEFDPFVTCKQEYPITKYQPVYFVAESFERAKLQVRQYAESMDRPFSVRYNPYTQSVEVLDTKQKLIDLANSIKADAALLSGALRHV